MQEAIVEAEWQPTKQDLKAYFAELAPKLNEEQIVDKEILYGLERDYE